jgi:hypothetical protein
MEATSKLQLVGTLFRADPATSWPLLTKMEHQRQPGSIPEYHGLPSINWLSGGDMHSLVALKVGTTEGIGGYRQCTAATARFVALVLW